MQFVADLEPNSDGALQIMYGIDGRRDLTESTRDDLSGYAGASPVRVGNGAFDQRQNDVFGAVLDSIHLHTARSQRLPRRLWPIVAGAGRVRDQGLARPRPGHLGGPRRPSALRLLEADVLGGDGPGREARRDRRRPRARARPGTPPPRRSAPTSSSTASATASCASTTTTEALDASTLLAAIFGFLPARRRAPAQVGRGDRQRPDRGRVRAPLPHRRDRRRPLGQGGQLPDLLLLAGLGPGGRRRGPARPRPDGEAAQRRLAARPLRRGVRHRDRPAPRQLPPGLLPPGADRGGGADHPRRATGGVRRDERLRRDRDRQRRRRRHARPINWRLRASGSCCSSAATGCRASRRTGTPRTSSSTTATSPRTPGTTPTARASSRRSTTSSAARRSSTARRSTACAPRTSASCATTTGSPRPGRSPTTSSSRTTPGPSSSTGSTAPAARTRPSLPRARRTRSRPSPTSPGSSSSPMTSPRPACIPSTPPAG